MEFQIQNKAGDVVGTQHINSRADLAQLTADSYVECEVDGAVKVIANITDRRGNRHEVGIATSRRNDDLTMRGVQSYRLGEKRWVNGWRYIRLNELDGRESNERWLKQHLVKLFARAESIATR